MAKQTLIKNATVLTMDAQLGANGDFERADILIDGSKILKVGENLSASGADTIDAKDMIAIPGLIDSHRHVWQANVRYLTSNWSFAEYALKVRGAVAGAYTAEDKYLGVYAGCLEALEAGVTTLVDFDHNVSAPEFADAAVTAANDARVRYVYCYGMGGVASKDVSYFDSFARPEWKEKDYQRVAQQYFADDDGRLHLGMALSESPSADSFNNNKQEIGWARAHNAKAITFHMSVPTPASVLKQIGDSGLMGPDILPVHGFFMSQEEFQLLADHGASVATTIESEMQMGMGYGAASKMKDLGVEANYGLGVDIVSNNSGDMFAPMRLSLQAQRAADNQKVLNHNETAARTEQKPLVVSVKAREVLEAATVGSSKAAGLADRVGTLTPGKQADIVLIDRKRIGMQPTRDMDDVAAAVVLYSSLAHVDTVMVAGEVVKRGGKLLVIKNEGELLDRLDKSNKRIQENYDKLLPKIPSPDELRKALAGG